VFHVSQLKEVAGNPQAEPAVVMEAGDPEYEVAKIVEWRAARGQKREFLVAWKGYSAFENSWEPEQNLSGCYDVLSAFCRDRGIALPLGSRPRRGQG
jgi:hypothetical protein